MFDALGGSSGISKLLLRKGLMQKLEQLLRHWGDQHFDTDEKTRWFRAAFELGRHKRFALWRLITKLDVLVFYSSRNLTSGRNKGGRSGQLESHSVKQCVFKNPQWYTNSRWLTNGSVHRRNNYCATWLDNVVKALCYFLAKNWTPNLSNLQKTFMRCVWKCRGTLNSLGYYVLHSQKYSTELTTSNFHSFRSLQHLLHYKVLEQEGGGKVCLNYFILFFIDSFKCRFLRNHISFSDNYLQIVKVQWRL